MKYVTPRHLASNPAWSCWHAMKRRCRNKKNKAFDNYGGRGIRVCERWLNFEFFLSDVGERPSPNHSIDSINNDGNYEPGNVRWSTQKEQCRNKRNNIVVEWQGEKKTLTEWSQILGLNCFTLFSRFKKGMTTEQLFRQSDPKKRRQKRTEKTK